LRVIVSGHGHLECRVVFGIFQRVDHGFCRQAMTKCVVPRPSLALGDGTGAQTRIAAVGLDLTEGAYLTSGPRIGFVSSF
jgi:hypothetical protein